MINLTPQRLRIALMLLCVVLASLTIAVAADKAADKAADSNETPKPPAATRPAHPDTPAWRAFERFKQLNGQAWQGKSTKGWTERLTYQLIAGDSVVMEQSEMAHADTKMVTMYSMDGEALYLTHYCAARNVPRMRATQISDDGGDVLFEFVDGLNLRDGRDTPHMDKAHIKFAADGGMSAQWTFYAKGKEQWMEEITYRRVASDDEK